MLSGEGYRQASNFDNTENKKMSNINIRTVSQQQHQNNNNSVWITFLNPTPCLLVKPLLYFLTIKCFVSSFVEFKIKIYKITFFKFSRGFGASFIIMNMRCEISVKRAIKLVIWISLCLTFLWENNETVFSDLNVKQFYAIAIVCAL